MHCPTCNGEELAKINGEWVECPGCDYEDVVVVVPRREMHQPMQERIAALKARLAEAQAEITRRESEWRQHQDLCKEAQFHNTRERHQTEDKLSEARDALDALHAKLEQAREALEESARVAAETTEYCRGDGALFYGTTPQSTIATFIKGKLAALDAGKPMSQVSRPTVVCLCGSTRFTDFMLVKQWELTKQGKIVLSWCALPDSYFKGSHIGDAEGVKEIVDEVHKKKIDLADEVMILNVGGYVGDSTRSEWRYAVSTGKPVTWLEPDKALDAGKQAGG